MAGDEDFGKPNTQVGYATRMLLRLLTSSVIAGRTSLLDFFLLCSHSEEISRSYWVEHYHRRCRVVAEALGELGASGYSLELLDTLSRSEGDGEIEQLLFKMICRIHCNAYGIKNLDLADCGNALFLQCAAINHSCSPNCAISPRMDCIQVKATKDIPAGAEISINYSVLEDSAARRSYLRENYFFECKCESCMKEMRLSGQMETQKEFGAARNQTGHSTASDPPNALAAEQLVGDHSAEVADPSIGTNQPQLVTM